MISKCSCNQFDGRHNFTPWVQERWRPKLDTRICMACREYETRQHIDGTEMFPDWLHWMEMTRLGVEK